jgi:hypothetical protein
MSKKYYFDELQNNKFDTIWYGFIEFDTLNNNILNDNIKMSNITDIIVDISNVNFYIFIEENRLYLSLDNDRYYYTYTCFEKTIREIIYKLIEYLSGDNINKIEFINGEFTGVEYKPNGCQYKYKLTKIDNKISLKKRILNWSENK